MTSSSTRITWLRPFTTHVFNRLARRFADRLPTFAILVNVGRRSGRVYETPINVFKRGERYVFALTYGTDVQWLKNILAAGRCTMRHRGRTMALLDPEVVHDPELRLMPAPVRFIGRLNRVTDLLVMRPATIRDESADASRAAGARGTAETSAGSGRDAVSPAG